MAWKRVGVIGATRGEDLWQAGAAQEYDTDGYGAAQEYDLGADDGGNRAQLTTQYPQRPRGSPQFRVPSSLAERLKQVPGEIYDIFPGVPNTTVSTNLTAGTANTDTDVHTFTPPVGNYIVLNPGDVTQEVLFETFTSNGRTSSDFIPGLITVHALTGLQGKRERLYAASSEFHNPFQNMSSVGHRRKWQLGYLISPGDAIITRFVGSSANGTATSTAHLDHRVLAKKITV